MSRTSYPTGPQLTTRLYAMGVITAPPSTTDAQLDFDSACEAAWEAWEDMSGYQPFLVSSGAADTTWYFDGDGSGTVDLEGAFVHITSVSVNGTVRALNTDYRTMPRNAAVAGGPITYLMFQGGWYRPFPAWYGQKAPVAVTGLRGYCTSLTAIAYEGILAIAIGSLLGDSEYSKFRGVKSWKIGTDEREYDNGAFERLAASCEAKIKRALNVTKRQKIA